MAEVTIYTDGACSGNPGPGGWGAILRIGENKKEISGGSANTTNNIMELTAVIEALKMLNEALVPEKAILSICGITKDVDGLGDDWKKNKQNQAQIEQQNNNQGINS